MILARVPVLLSRCTGMLPIGLQGQNQFALKAMPTVSTCRRNDPVEIMRIGILHQHIGKVADLQASAGRRNPPAVGQQRDTGASKARPLGRSRRTLRQWRDHGAKTQRQREAQDG